MRVCGWIKLTDRGAVLNGREIKTVSSGASLLSELYRNHVNKYPKFFKMDALSKLGFISTELLLQSEESRFTPREDRAVVFVNRSGSLVDDTHYQATIADKENYYPSPSVFVYTLPNIVTGEVAIRNQYYGETCFHVIDEYRPSLVTNIIADAFLDESTTSVIGGWLECSDDQHFKACLFIVDQMDEVSSLPEWNEQTIIKLINNK